MPKRLLKSKPAPLVLLPVLVEDDGKGGIMPNIDGGGIIPPAAPAPPPPPPMARCICNILRNACGFIICLIN